MLAILCAASLSLACLHVIARIVLIFFRLCSTYAFFIPSVVIAAPFAVIGGLVGSATTFVIYRGAFSPMADWWCTRIVLLKVLVISMFFNVLGLIT